ncbi:MAG: site-specific DNA-methyltransferase [Metallibacterium scheffleri]|jgi:site-specific DNA-methyltransferase (adenine-specific)/adenine-specific DNA-methyltransferase|uniref:site-specific DNA-methyltransferase n=1 Tax=Metallibacterium scheffleri TaxID=993689 RepID=UPI0026EE8179|nr:site-specific DNA-methyltransferase [Metallibacterium scheffleri]MCK9365945.1 site-specific DNA-methyltransferase [Metallibacterium scheffleri]
MPTLNWIGKAAVVKHHREVPFRLLEPVPELSLPSPSGSGVGDEGDYGGNLIVQGDNLHALKALLPRYAGQVKCIYIDPPYNTGNEGWVYNDNVNSPEIRKWLGEVVGKEGETLDRHDRWLSMMYPRLVLLKQFLREDGAIFVSIDDNEVATLRLLMDEIFGAKNFVASAIWNMMDSPKNSARHLSEDHEYVVLYAANKDKWRPNPLPRSEAMIARYKNPDNDPRGPWLLSDLAARNFYAQGRYAITTPSGKVIDGPPSGSYWRVSEEKFWELDRDNRIWWGKTGSNRPGIKRFLTDVKDGVVPRTLWPWQEVGSTRHSKQEISQILNLGASSDLFVTPKPTALIQRILQIATDADSLVLDSFAGSGTTGHAVLKQSAEDGGNRRFILVEMDENIARTVTAERVKRVATGYTKGALIPDPAPASGRGEKIVEGLGGGFQFCRLSAEPLFDADGQIRSDVTFAQLAEFVWFAETGTARPHPGPLPAGEGEKLSPLLGVHEGRAIYLLYNGILKDRSVAGGNVLTGPVFDVLPRFAGPKVIYAAANRMGGRAAREGITFKQTPYALEP